MSVSADQVRSSERAVRIATIAAIVATCFALGSVFLPTGQITVKGPTVTHTAARSLYDLGKSTGAVRSFLHSFRSSTAKKIGVKVLDKLSPHLRGRVGEQADEIREAVAILDGLRDRDIDTAGKVMAGVLWTLIALNVLLVLLLQGTDASTSRARVWSSCVLAFIAAAVAVGVYVALTRIVATANAELERDLFALRTGAYLLPIAAVVALATVVAMTIAHVIARGRRAAAGPAPVAMPPR